MYIYYLIVAFLNVIYIHQKGNSVAILEYIKSILFLRLFSPFFLSNQSGCFVFLI